MWLNDISGAISPIGRYAYKIRTFDCIINLSPHFFILSRYQLLKIKFMVKVLNTTFYLDHKGDKQFFQTKMEQTS